MASLVHIHPEVGDEFIKGNFTVQKTRHTFPFIVIIQAHKQNNDVVKGDGGADGLTQNSEVGSFWF